NSVAADDMAAMAAAAGIAATPAAGVVPALDAIAAGASGPGRVLVCGSLYLAGTVLADAAVLPKVAGNQERGTSR
ncbi:MAG: hypothetical protein VW405_22350, partial [Rhodospirillaceae bacterium]